MVAFIAFMIGLFVGSGFGLVIAGLLYANGRDE